MRCDLCPLSNPEVVCPEVGGAHGMEIEMDLTPKELERALAICQHMVGLDYKRPYHRHGKAFYRAYRNYYYDLPEGNRLLDKMPKELFRVHRNEHSTTYYLTQTGLDWLGHQLHVKLYGGADND